MLIIFIQPLFRMGYDANVKCFFEYQCKNKGVFVLKNKKIIFDLVFRGSKLKTHLFYWFFITKEGVQINIYINDTSKH